VTRADIALKTVLRPVGPAVGPRAVRLEVPEVSRHCVSVPDRPAAGKRSAAAGGAGLDLSIGHISTKGKDGSL
jgi:hypothetical protein